MISGDNTDYSNGVPSLVARSLSIKGNNSHKENDITIMPAPTEQDDDLPQLEESVSEPKHDGYRFDDWSGVF